MVTTHLFLFFPELGEAAVIPPVTPTEKRKGGHAAERERGRRRSKGRRVISLDELTPARARKLFPELYADEEQEQERTPAGELIAKAPARRAEVDLFKEPLPGEAVLGLTLDDEMALLLLAGEE